MSSILYFAYGSNTLTTRLQRRCNTAQFYSLAVAQGYRVTFDKKSKDSSGKANIAACDTKGSTAGVLFEISKAELEQLDRAEGPGYAIQDEFPITCLETGNQLKACTYVAKEVAADLKPFDWYLALIVAGLSSHRIDQSYVQGMGAMDFVVDTNQNRKSRVDALTDLRAAGYAEYSAILRNSTKHAL